MSTYVAFLRAINLGATRKFPKADLQRVVEEAGFGRVATYINTGNVRLDSRMRSTDRVSERLEAAFLADRGFAVPTIVLTCDELAGIAADADEVDAGLGEGFALGVHYVSMLPRTPDPEAIAALEALDAPGERVVVRGRGVHILLAERDSYQRARLGNHTVEKHLGVATNRNVNVIRHLAASWS